MLKDYIVFDNILENPEELVNLSKITKYYSKEDTIIPGMILNTSNNIPTGNWVGYRTDSLHNINQDLFQRVLNQVFSKVFETEKFNYTGNAHLHRTTKHINSSDDMWHTDSDYVLAGIIYLNKDAPDYGGTLLNYQSNTIKVVPKFNRLVLYKANVLHSPNQFFGDSMEDSRLTLTMFIEHFSLQYGR
jgi:Rps23 Pro-64 3,4-dihydroxylase Tpa1-like proline 4-hydroxylase